MSRIILSTYKEGLKESIQFFVNVLYQLFSVFIVVNSLIVNKCPFVMNEDMVKTLGHPCAAGPAFAIVTLGDQKTKLNWEFFTINSYKSYGNMRL